jgi:hypothetical protein
MPMFRTNSVYFTKQQKQHYLRSAEAFYFVSGSKLIFKYQETDGK